MAFLFFVLFVFKGPLLSELFTMQDRLSHFSSEGGFLHFVHTRTCVS